MSSRVQSRPIRVGLSSRSVSKWFGFCGSDSTPYCVAGLICIVDFGRHSDGTPSVRRYRDHSLTRCLMKWLDCGCDTTRVLHVV